LVPEEQKRKEQKNKKKKKKKRERTHHFKVLILGISLQQLSLTNSRRSISKIQVPDNDVTLEKKERKAVQGAVRTSQKGSPPPPPREVMAGKGGHIRQILSCH